MFAWSERPGDAAAQLCYVSTQSLADGLHTHAQTAAVCRAPGGETHHPESQQRKRGAATQAKMPCLIQNLSFKI